MRLLPVGLFALLVALPGAQACQVVPLVDLDFPEKSACRPQAPCDPIPAEGGSETYEGTVLWSWDADECTVQNGLPGGEVTIRISETSTTPAWMTVRAEPETITIPPEEQVHPSNMRTEDVGGTTRVYFQVEKPVTVTFTREAAIDQAGIDRIEGRGGVLPLFVKAHSESSTGNMAAFGVEEFRFDGSPVLEDLSGEASEESTPFPVPVTMLALVGALWAARRR